VSSVRQERLLGGTVLPDEFAQQMQWLKEQSYQTISLEDLVQGVDESQSLPEKPVIITFDDGYRDLKQNAFPILQSFCFGATVFLVSDLVGQNGSWDISYGCTLAPLLSWDEMREVQTGGIHFESHADTHVSLTSLLPDEAHEEIRRSKHTIENKLGRTVRFLCYPYGEYNEKVKQWTRESGYLGACTIAGGKNGPDCDRYAIRRIMITGYDSLLSFKFKLLSGYGFPISFQAKLHRILKFRRKHEN